MCYRVIYALAIALMVFSGYGKELRRKINQDFNFGSTQSIKKNPNNGQMPRKLMSRRSTNVRTPYTIALKKYNNNTLNYGKLVPRSLNTQKLSHSLYFPSRSRKFKPFTLKNQSNTLNSFTYNPLKISDRIFNLLRVSRTLKVRSPIPHKFSNAQRAMLELLNSPTLRTRTLDSPMINTGNIYHNTITPIKLKRNDKSAKPAKRNRKLGNDLFNDENLKTWFKDTDVKIPDDIDEKGPFHIEGLQRFKKRFKEMKQIAKRRSNLNDNEIIPNDKYELENLQIHPSAVPNFNASFAGAASERLYKIHSDYLKHKLLEKSGRRNYDYYYPPEITTTTKKPNTMDRIMALMHQFLHQSQQRLINGELLRNKYVVNVKFKIGYVFSTLRILKQQQMRLYSSMHFYRFFTPRVWGTNYAPVGDSMYYLMLYEKILRLNDDIVTLVDYLWTLEDVRKVEAAIDKTRFPKRTKYTDALHWTFKIKITSYYG